MDAAIETNPPKHSHHRSASKGPEAAQTVKRSPEPGPLAALVRPNYVPPLNFSLVEDGIYRSGFPMPISYPFLAQLKLKTIIYLGDLGDEKKKDKKSKPEGQKGAGKSEKAGNDKDWSDSKDKCKDSKAEDKNLSDSKDKCKDSKAEDKCKDLKAEDKCKDLKAEDKCKDSKEEDKCKDSKEEDKCKDSKAEDKCKDSKAEDKCKDSKEEDKTCKDSKAAKDKKDKLSSSEILQNYKAWIETTDIAFHHLVMHSSQEPFTSNTQDDAQTPLTEALQLMLNKDNFPILIHSNKGKHRIGVLVGLMRKILQGWCISGIFEEYEKFALGKSEYDLEFIELWQPELFYEESKLPEFVRI